MVQDSGKIWADKNPPPNAYTLVGAAIAGATNSCFDPDRTASFPPAPGKHPDIKAMMPSFSIGVRPYTVLQSDMANGSEAMAEGLHAAMRAQVLRVHNSYIAQVVPQLETQKFDVPKAALESYRDTLGKLKDVMDKQQIQLPRLAAHYQDINTRCAKTDNPFTLADEVKIFADSYHVMNELFTRTQSCNEMVKLDLKDLKREMSADLGTICDDILKNVNAAPTVHLTLRDRENNPVEVDVPSQLPDGAGVGGVIIGALTGGGLLDDGRVLDSQRDILVRLLGQAQTLTGRMEAFENAVRGALKAKGVNDIEGVLQKSGISISAKTWGNLRNDMIAANLPNACFEDYVGKLGSFLIEPEEFKSKPDDFFAKTMGRALEHVCMVLEIKTPKEESMKPVTRRHYAGLMRALDHAVWAVGEKMASGPAELKAEQQKLGTSAKLVSGLLPPAREGKPIEPYIAKKSRVHDAPSQDQMERIRARVAELKAFDQKLSQTPYHDDCFSKLLEIAERGLDVGTHGQAAQFGKGASAER